MSDMTHKQHDCPYCQCRDDAPAEVMVHVVQRSREKGTYLLYFPGFATHIQDQGSRWWRGNGETYPNINSLVEALMDERGIDSFDTTYWSEERAAEAPDLAEVMGW